MALRISAIAALSVLTLGYTPMRKAVLVVDDNALIRQVLCRVFTSEAGFDVCGEAENGQDAIEKARALHPDLIVMDLSMPVMNGIDATRALKTLMPMVPVIVFSEYSDVFSEKEARSAGSRFKPTYEDAAPAPLSLSGLPAFCAVNADSELNVCAGIGGCCVEELGSGDKVEICVAILRSVPAFSHHLEPIDARCTSLRPVANVGIRGPQEI